MFNQFKPVILVLYRKLPAQTYTVFSSTNTVPYLPEFMFLLLFNALQFQLRRPSPDKVNMNQVLLPQKTH